MTGFMVNGKETLLQTDYITKRADLSKRLWYLLEFLGKEKLGFTLSIRLYPNGDWVFQQDGAPAHTSKTTQEYIDGATPDFIRKDEWPPQSPDCNPMDYALWDSFLKRFMLGNRTNAQRTN